ncbi:SigE family RNA polymerase sigma factor [Nocardioides sp.]|uniref:SigE family RNA polymerase sigma factor n=1 Tax=Nocardioides sp. TaxID=35761 RepID=UPI0039E409F1
MDEFEAWARGRTASLSRAAYLLTGDLQRAEDLVQETLIRVAGHWRRISRSGEPDAYARTVLHRLAVDSWRRQRARPTEVSAEHPELGVAGPDVERRLLVREALLRLTPRQRAVLVLRYLDDLTEVQTAAVLGCSPNTVKSQARQALARLRDLAPDLLAELEVR